MTTDEPLPLRTDEDVVRARHRVRELAQQAGLRLVDQTKLVTAVSELARNTIIHGGGGQLTAGLLRTAPATACTRRSRTTGPGSRTSSWRSPTATAPAMASGSASAAPGAS